MRYNKILLFIMIFASGVCNAQMFDFLEYMDKQNVEQTTIGQQVNTLYDNFELKIKDLVLWELQQFKRVQEEIDFESKDLPSNRIMDLKLDKFAELELLITTKEIDLDFWYMEQLDELNEQAKDKNLDVYFIPETQIQGRIIKVVLKHLLQDEQEYNKYTKNFEYGLTGAEFVATTAIVPGIIVSVASSQIIKVTEKVVNKIIENYSKYFSIGMVSNDREIQLEKIKYANL